MSTAISSLQVNHSAVVPSVPTLPQRRVTNADSLYNTDNQAGLIVVFCNPADADPAAIVAELRDRGCIVTRANLAESSYEPAAEALTQLSQAVQCVTHRSTPITAVSVSAPYRGPTLEPQCLEFDGLVIDRRRHTVRVANRFVEFSKTELDLLYLLASYSGIVLSRRELVDACKGESYPATDRSVDVQIVGIRRKLGPVRDYLQTVRGVGYRFEPTTDHSERRAALPK